MSDKKSLHEVLVAARNRIEGRWIKGIYGVGENFGKTCLVGGIYTGITGESRCTQTGQALDQIIHNGYEEQLDILAGRYLPLPYNSVRELVHFNDRYKTSEKDVLDFLDKCIADTAPPPEDLKLEVHQEQPLEAALAGS